LPKNSRPPPIQNHLLAALPDIEYKRLLPHLESVRLPFMEVLYESGDAFEHVYFTNEGLISLLVVMGDETTREVGLIGSEGMLGTAVLLGMNTTPIRTRTPGGHEMAKMRATVFHGVDVSLTDTGVTALADDVGADMK